MHNLTTHTLISTCLLLASSHVTAVCPVDMPTQLLEDCIVVEGAGSAFPNATYAYMDEYKAWEARHNTAAPDDSATQAKLIRRGSRPDSMTSGAIDVSMN